MSKSMSSIDDITTYMIDNHDVDRELASDIVSHYSSEHFNGDIPAIFSEQDSRSIITMILRKRRDTGGGLLGILDEWVYYPDNNDDEDYIGSIKHDNDINQAIDNVLYAGIPMSIVADTAGMTIEEIYTRYKN